MQPGEAALDHLALGAQAGAVLAATPGDHRLDTLCPQLAPVLVVELVLRLLRGESLDLLAREIGQPAGRIAGWRDDLALRLCELAVLDRRRTGLQPLAAAGQELGELQMENDILGALLAKKSGPGEYAASGQGGALALARSPLAARRPD